MTGSGHDETDSLSAEGPVCRQCQRRFTPNTPFCPFDGTRLAERDRGHAPDPLLGERVDGRYKVVRVLGEGGMGVVYEVRHEVLERPFALKVLRRELSADADLCERFIREARAAAAVDHPGVVSITDFGALPTGQPYFVMELLGGRSLARLMAEVGALSLDRFLAIVEQLVDALAAAHRVDVVHRDLKPDNIQILTDKDGGDSVKVLDFGLAQVGGANRLTQKGLVFGTPYYMSPEQAQGCGVDHRADVYALGVLMYEMITGGPPFEADSYMGVLAQHIHSAPVRPSKRLGGRPLGALEVVILRCLEKKPSKRYARLEELAGDLRAAVVKTPNGVRVVRRLARGRADQRSERPGSPPTLGTKRSWLSAIAIGGVLFGGLVVWKLLPSMNASEEPLPTQLTNPLAGGGEETRREPTFQTEQTPERDLPVRVGREPESGGVGLEPKKVADARTSRVTTRAVVPSAKARTTTRAGTPRSGANQRTPAAAPIPTTEIVDPWANASSQ